MATWDWEDVDHRIVSPADLPTAGALAAKLANYTIVEDLERTVPNDTGLPGFPLWEGSIGHDTPILFKLLRDAGSHTGYVVKQGTSQVLAFELSEQVARQISNDLCFEPPMAFVDDQCLCALVSYWSDFVQFCMREDLLLSFVSSSNFDFTLWSDSEPFPKAHSLADIQKLAQRRKREWIERCERPQV